MPFKSARQRKYLFARKPDVAKRIARDSKRSGRKAVRRKRS